MTDKFHAAVNTTWNSVPFDYKLTKLFSIEKFSGAKHAGKVLIIIIILFLIIIIIIKNETDCDVPAHIFPQLVAGCTYLLRRYD